MSRAGDRKWPNVPCRSFLRMSGPCEIGTPAKVRCPKELTHILQRTAAVWEPGSPWLSQRPRIGPVIRVARVRH